MAPSKHSQALLRLYIVFALILIFILATLRALPQWRPHILFKTWADAAHDVSFPFSDHQLGIKTNRTTPSATAATATPHAENGSSTEKDLPPSQTAITDDGPQFELVVSHYRADLAWVKKWTDQVRQIPFIQQLGLKLTIYTKKAGTDLVDLKARTGADEVHVLPNLGREGQTMLHHIIKNYENPARFTMFSQAEPEWAYEEDGSMVPYYHRKLFKDFRPNTGFLGLNEWNEICTCGDCGERGHFPLQTAIFNMFEDKICHGENWNGLWGQFIVSRKRMQAPSLKAYKWLNTMLSAPADHWLHAEVQPDFIKPTYMPQGSAPDNPLFGHTVERSWSTIFHCSYVDEIRESGMGIIGEHESHCWDWKVQHNESSIQPEHYPGFGEIDAQWLHEEKQHELKQRQKQYQNMMEASRLRTQEAEALNAQAENLKEQAQQMIQAALQAAQEPKADVADSVAQGEKSPGGPSQGGLGVPKKDLRTEQEKGTRIEEIS